ncbi:MAG: hypothetical protein JRG97_05935 [Deltaproteobacteria bacterium]|nr:hypothetical protein [Deltaproteobacteria bacterium]MBW2052278.1 hypothetical protein [Deltaproteobacteria bacterium]MBW2140598.1 hypothetical protein [Deltaproteobacteria bacterium]MBW2324210.1 hypothetical protein [Deltaproteobacteria bacterium]
MTYLRWLIIIVLFYLIYRVLKGLIMPRQPFEEEAARPRLNENKNNEDAEDLIQDPNCGVYIPKRDAIPAAINGKTHYFCSQECREKYTKVQNQ